MVVLSFRLTMQHPGLLFRKMIKLLNNIQTIIDSILSDKDQGVEKCA